VGLDLVDSGAHIVVVDEVDQPIREKFDTPIAFTAPSRWSCSIARQDP
jgi:hypothetical protein